MNVWRKIATNNTLDKISFILIATVLVTLPLGFAMNSISIILLFLFGIYKSIKEKRKLTLPKDLIFFLLCGVYILSIFSLLWTDNFSNTTNGLTSFISYLILPISFLLHANLQKNKLKVIEVFAFSLTIYALYCVLMGFLNYIKTADVSFLFYHKLSNNLYELNAIYLSVFVSFAFGYFLSKKNKSKLHYASLFILAVFMILLSSKIIVFITFLLTLFFLVKQFKFQSFFNKKTLFLGLVFSLVIVLASKNIKERIKIEYDKTSISEALTKKDFGHVYLWTGTSLRAFQLRVFSEIISKKKTFFLGLGLNNSQPTLEDKYKEYNLYEGFFSYNFHNQYIQIFAELGILGLLFLVVLFVIPFYEAIKSNDFLLLYFITIIATVCLTESFLWRQRGMVFFITILLLLYIPKTQKIRSHFE